MLQAKGLSQDSAGGGGSTRTKRRRDGLLSTVETAVAKLLTARDSCKEESYLSMVGIDGHSLIN